MSKFFNWALISTDFPRDDTHLHAAYIGFTKCRDIVFQWLRENNMSVEDCDRLASLLETKDYDDLQVLLGNITQ